MVRITLCAAFLVLAGCATTQTAGSYCDIARPLRLSEKTISVMSDAEVRDVLKHNSVGQRLCHWQN